MTFLKSGPANADAVADEYAATISGSSLPKYRIPNGSSEPRAVFDLVRDELFMDGNSRQNVATFCTTYADDEVRRLMDLSIDKNMIDKDEYPQTAEIEKRCVHMLADLWHAPQSWETTGCSTTSEACMLGGLALKWQWKKRREAEGKPTDKPNIVCGPVQVCWEKFARYFGGLAGMWIIAGVGLVGVVFSFVVSFFPPDQLPVGSSSMYVGLVISGIVIFAGIPLIIHQLRRSNWAAPDAKLVPVAKSPLH